MTKTQKTAKTVKSEKNATVAPKTETKTETKTAKKTAKPAGPKMGKYGAPAVRPNRADKIARSKFGDRKWIFRGVTAVDKSGNVAATDTVNSMPLDKKTAEMVLSNALKNPEIVNGRLFYKRPDENGVEMRGVYIAYKSDNGELPKPAQN